jgi:hypothetical protein
MEALALTLEVYLLLALVYALGQSFQKVVGAEAPNNPEAEVTSSRSEPGRPTFHTHSHGHQERGLSSSRDGTA